MALAVFTRIAEDEFLLEYLQCNSFVRHIAVVSLLEINDADRGDVSYLDDS